MAPLRRAYPAANRRLPLTALCALCLLACALAASALGSSRVRSPIARAAASHSSAPAHHTSGHRRTHARGRHCARLSSFHERGGGKARHHKRRAACHRRGPAKGHHTTGVRHAHSHNSAPHATTPHKTKHQSATPPSPASHSSSCPDADLRPSAADLERIRAATLCLVNRERTGHGEGPLQADGRLQQSAQGHSDDMASGDYFEHVGPHGDTPLARMRAAGYAVNPHLGYEVGENIGWGTLWLATPRAIVASWMGSPGHRANILDGAFRDTGVGVSPRPLSSLARGQAGGMYTQDFGVILGA